MTLDCIDIKQLGVKEGKWASILDANLEHNCGAKDCITCTPYPQFMHNLMLNKYGTMGKLKQMIAELIPNTPRAGPHWDKGWASRQAEINRYKLSQMRRHERKWREAYKELKA
tara:strand:- start:6363 stop:6701 length:339 start_codon:yes stop_codon:yes gene_type:complete